MTPSDEELSGGGRRLIGLLLTGVSAGSIAYIAALTVTTLVAEEITGLQSWSGLPIGASVLGTAAGTSLLPGAMRRWGRRRGLALFYAVGAAGSLAAIAATVERSLPFLVGGLFVVGIGNSASALTRYVAADLRAPERRAATVGWVVWAGTVGAVFGPNLLSPTAVVAVRLGLPELAGAYLATFVLFTLAAVLYLALLRPDSVVPSQSDSSVDEAAAETGREHPRSLFRTRRVQVALATLILGQLVMVLIMTMTPLRLKELGFGLDFVGLVMSTHFVGMFVLAPVTGRLVDRFGGRPMMFAGQLLLLVAVGSAAWARPSDTGLTMTALFLLGLGWNFGFIAGSAALSSEIAVVHRSWLQGRADSMVWVAAAIASSMSSVLLATIGFAGLSMVAAAMVLILFAIVALRSRPLPGDPTPISRADS